MSVLDVVFNKDIVLDEAAFNQAVQDFADLAVQVANLRADVEEMLEILKAGFDTPAGVKFINSCETNLFEPLDAQKVVIEHISETLRQSREAYETVFREYENLQATIKQVK